MPQVIWLKTLSPLKWDKSAHKYFTYILTKWIQLHFPLTHQEVGYEADLIPLHHDLQPLILLGHRRDRGATGHPDLNVMSKLLRWDPIHLQVLDASSLKLKNIK